MGSVMVMGMICASPEELQGASPHAAGRNPDSKVHGANMGPIWGRQDPGGPHVGPMNFAISEYIALIIKRLMYGVEWQTIYMFMGVFSFGA